MIRFDSDSLIVEGRWAQAGMEVVSSRFAANWEEAGRQPLTVALIKSMETKRFQDYDANAAIIFGASYWNRESCNESNNNQNT